MWKPSHRALKLLFCAFALIALSACAVKTDTAKQPAFTNLCDPLLTDCATGELLPCDPLLKDCTTGILLPCDPLLKDCDTGELLPCDPALLLKDCDTGLYITGGVDSSTNYQPSNTVEPPTGGWAAALTTARTDEYDESGGNADQIGAAYAYARGYSGAGITVSFVGQAIDRTHADLAGQLIDGYKADTKDSTANAGSCAGDTAGSCPSEHRSSTHIAGIIAGKTGNFVDGGLIQGIAYGAKMKPINIFQAGTLLATSEDRAFAIAEASKMDAAACTMDSSDTASCAPITVMHNNWISSDFGTCSVMDVDYRCFTDKGDISVDSSIFSDKEKSAWIEAVKTTVLVFGAGAYGHNSENGMVLVLNSESFSREPDVAWSSVTGGGGTSISERPMPDCQF